ncbi:MAG: sigma-70 family RNA polymerase sigma factor [Planctomycetes bacterium]|nr:sigma-70 family RNA polymerase sigma factor [Planctomycetota bacterium]
MTGQDATAQDLVQETALRAYRAFATYLPGSNFRAWIFRILTNTFINEYRRKIHQAHSVDVAEADPGDAADLNPVNARDVEALTETLGDDARRAIDRLPPDFRLVFLLATFEGFTYKELADVLDIPIGTVMSRLHRARQIVRTELLSKVRGTSP